MATAVQIDNSVLSYRFFYDGAWRVVDNVNIVDKHLVGFEMRKNGKFSYQIKKFRLDKIETIGRIDPPKRCGPKIGRPMETGR